MRPPGAVLSSSKRIHRTTASQRLTRAWPAPHRTPSGKSCRLHNRCLDLSFIRPL